MDSAAEAAGGLSSCFSSAAATTDAAAVGADATMTVDADAEPAYSAAMAADVTA